MSETYLPPDGVRVRVVLEGPVSNSREGSFSVGVGNRRNVIYPGSDHVVSIEKKARVGDTLSTLEDYAAVPAGTIVLAGCSSIGTYLKNGYGWTSNGSSFIHSDATVALAARLRPHTIIHLPS